MSNKTEIVDRYLAVWSEPDPEARRGIVGALWAPDGAEFVEGARFRGHRELEDRVGEAYREFVGSGRFTVASAGDPTHHDDIVSFTIQLLARAGDDSGKPAWAARVFLLLGPDGRIQEDYQLTVQTLKS